MATPSLTPPAAPARRESARIQLARLASDAALTEAGVTGPGGSALQATFSGTERIPGVTVVADGSVHAVALFLTAEPTDLHALSDRVIDAARRSAARAGLGDALGSVHVTFTDLTLPSESSAA